MGAIAAAGFDYYQAYQSKKHQKYQNVASKKGVSFDANMRQANVKGNKLAAKRARKYGMTP